jgi:hypothetical protein
MAGFGIADYLAGLQTGGEFGSRHKRSRVWVGARAGALVHFTDGSTGLLLGWTGRSNWWGKRDGLPWFEGPIVQWPGRLTYCPSRLVSDGSPRTDIWVGLHPQMVKGWTNP